jgi:hypothetical protein
MTLSDCLAAIHRTARVVFPFSSAIWRYKIHCILESEQIFRRSKRTLLRDALRAHEFGQGR